MPAQANGSAAAACAAAAARAAHASVVARKGEHELHEAVHANEHVVECCLLHILAFAVTDRDTRERHVQISIDGITDELGRLETDRRGAERIESACGREVLLAGRERGFVGIDPVAALERDREGLVNPLAGILALLRDRRALTAAATTARTRRRRSRRRLESSRSSASPHHEGGGNQYVSSHDRIPQNESLSTRCPI